MNASSPPRLRILGQSAEVRAVDREFSARFRLGRGTECEVRVDSALASRIHAEAWWDGSVWRIRDLDSTNGLFVDGRPVHEAPLHHGAVLRIGRDGAELRVELEAPAAPAAPTVPPTPTHTPADATATTTAGTVPPAPPSGAASVNQAIERYFGDGDEEGAGERTRLIRQAYRKVSHEQTRRSRKILAAVGAVLLLTLLFGAWQRVQNQRLRDQAEDIFLSLKELDVTIVNLRRLVEQQGGAELSEQLARLDAQKARLSAQYEGYVRDMGVYRRLRSEEERLIYRTARVFGESETTMSRDFVERVQAEIHDYWLGPGRARFERAVRRAADNDYTPFVVETLREYGLPPQFFYLALQESDFIPDRVGPPTRWGHAKGAWQFIPSTARRYGLNPGLRADTDAVDPLDERQNFFLATDAAARYLLDLHGVLTQSSGLLVMASYNWGEHRVLPRLEDLPTPDAVFDATFEDVPADPEWRNYWRFLSEYGERMPDETKDYVLKIFAAAVIGSDPRYFGFAFDDPLAAYVDDAAD